MKISPRCCGLLLAVSIPALAQAPDPASAEVPLEEVTVTGSRVRNASAESSSPVKTIDATALALSGSPTPESFLNRLPQVAPSDNSSSNRGEGLVTVDLRNLGPTRTLVLVNGRRFASANGLGVVDLNSIPTSLIERTEVVTGGASAVYGSDALAGVVNFILKDDFEGASFKTQVGASERGDGDTTLAEAILGTNFAEDRGNVVLSASYFKRDPIWARDRDAMRVSVNGGSATVPSGRIENLGGNPNPQAGAFLGGTSTVRDYIFTPGGGIEPFTSALPTANPDGDRYNFTEKEYLVVPQDRVTVGALAKLQVSDNIETFLEAFFSDNRVQLRGAESPFTNGRLSPTNPLLPQVARDMLAQRPDPAANASFVRVLTELGPRLQLRNTDTYQLNFGARGEIGSSWNWEGVYGYGRTEQENTIQGGASQSRIDASLLGCPGNSTQVFGCRPINFFGANTLSADDVQYIRATTAKDAITFTRSDATISLTGPVMSLPAGEAKAALGIEYREDSFGFSPDDMKIRGDLAGYARAAATEGKFDVKEAFGELIVPLLRDLPGVRDLSLELGGRYSDYSSVGDLFTYKAGTSWRPVQDVRLRVLFQRAIRAPSVFELFQGGDLQFITFQDPCATVLASGASAAPPTAERATICQLQGLADPRVAGFTQVSRTIEALYVGNTQLDEETSSTWTAGLVVTPSAVPGLQITADLFRIKVENYINRAFGGVAGTLNACYSSGVTTLADYDAHPACRLLYRTASGELRSNLPLANVQTLETSGADVQLNYELDLQSVGTLSLIANVTYVDKYETLGRDFVGLVSQDFGANPDLRSYVELGWHRGRAEARINWQRIASMREQLSRREIPAVDYFNLTGTFEVSPSLQLYAGINNLLDQDPPIFPNQIQNTDTSTYDVIGRSFFLGANMSFGR